MRFRDVTGLLTLGISIVIWLTISHKPKLTDHPFKAIQQQNDSLLHYNASLEKQMQHLRQEADRFHQKARQQQQLMYHLKTQQHEKMQAIHHFTDLELYQFFARFKTTPSENK